MQRPHYDQRASSREQLSIGFAQQSVLSAITNNSILNEIFNNDESLDANLASDSNQSSNIMMSQNVYEFMSKLEKTNRLMKNLRFSDTYNEVVRSLLNENLLQYSKNYNLNAKSVNKMADEDDFDTFNQNNNNQAKLERKNSFILRQKRYLLNAGPILLNNKNSLSRNSIPVVRISDCDRDAIDPNISQVNNELINQNSTAIKPRIYSSNLHKNLTAYRVGSSGSSSFKSTSTCKPKSVSSTKTQNSSIHSMPISLHSSVSFASSSKKSHKTPRLTDLLLDGYKKTNSQLNVSNSETSTFLLPHEMDTLNSFHDNRMYENEDFSSTSANKFHDESFLTSSFHIKRYNIKEKSELEMAKNDVMKRYSVISDTQMRALSASKADLSSFRKSKRNSGRNIF
jgi:hypothetical protein